MANELQKHATKMAAEVTGKMFCSNCQMTRAKEGGIWKVTADRMRRRWTCAGCVENYKNRHAPNVKDAG
jgi:hypothetical protein